MAKTSNQPPTYAHLADAYQQGRIQEVIEQGRRVIQNNPEHAEAYHLVGLALYRLGRHDQATDVLEAAVRLATDKSSYHNSLGVVYKAAGRLAEAAQAFNQAISLNPNNADACNNLGNTYRLQGELRKAREALHKAVSLKKDYYQACNNLGLVHADLNEPDRAQEYYQKALAIKPDYAEALNNLAYAYQLKGDPQKAIQAYQDLISRCPNYAPAYNNLGLVLKEQGRRKEAISCYQKALKIKPDYYGAYNNLGTAYKDQGQIEEALSCFQQALKIKPDYAKAHNNLLLDAHYSPGWSQKDLYEEHRRWARRYAEPLKTEIRPHSNPAHPDKQLRIGLLSADFGQHPVGFFTLAFLEHYNRQEFLITVYANRHQADTYTQKIRDLADNFRFVATQSDSELARTIRQDQIDILVDLSGHTKNNRLLVFARKPAPVQFTWAAYPDTTGLDTMDYLLTDLQETPTGAENCYSETLWRLPDDYICYYPAPAMPRVGPLPAQANGLITFGCFNNLAKIGPQVIALWSRILKALPQAKLFLKNASFDDPHTQKLYLDRFDKHGISGQRLILEGRSPQPELLACYNRVDIALDPFPYSGGLTTCEALYMGVPVITLPGDTFASRHSLTHLTNAGLRDWVAVSEEDYLQKAIAAARDVKALIRLRQGLRRQVADSPLCDGPRFTRNLEDAFRQMWRIWCRGKDNSTPQEQQKTPAKTETLWQRAVTLHTSGEITKAEQAYRLILQQEPRHSVCMANLATLIKEREPQEALQLYRKAIEIRPDYVEAYYNQGNLLRALGRLEQAKVSYETAVKLSPDHLKARNNLALTFRLQRQYQQALATVNQVIQQSPQFGEAYINQGNIYWDQNQLSQALESYQTASRLMPDHAPVWRNIGVCLRNLGDFDPARQAFEKSLQIDSTDAQSLYYLASLHKLEAEAPILKDMQTLAEQAHKLPAEKQVHLFFALGKAYDDCRKYEQAFEAFQQGNSLKRQSLKYSSSAQEAFCQKMESAFSKEFIEQTAQHGHHSRQPILIVGMPRSGTTLVERILASHPDVYGAGELTHLQQIFHTLARTFRTGSSFEALSRIKPGQWPELGQEYLDALPGEGRHASHVLDKMPINFWFLGFFHCLFPKARIIHCRRHPLDTCLSNYMHLFTGGLNFSFDLRELGHYYRLYERIMHHWQQVLPASAVMTVDYEDIVTTPHLETEKLLDFAGLSHHRECFHHQEKARQTGIRTASVVQVRSPIYQSAMYRWQNYAPHLAPLIQTISPGQSQTGPAGSLQELAGTVDRLINAQYSGEAEQHLNASCREFMAQAEYYRLLGLTCRFQGKHFAARNLLKLTVLLNPNQAAAHNSLSVQYWQNGNLEAAEDHARQAVRLDPAFSEALVNLGNILRTRMQPGQARDSYNRALEMNPGSAGAHNGLGVICKDLGENNQAWKHFQEALQINPTYNEARANLLLTSLYLEGATDNSIQATHTSWAPGADFEEISPPGRPANKKPVIGVLSPDLGDHPVGLLFAPVIKALAGHDLSLVIYSDRRQEDRLSQDIRSRAETWHQCCGWTDKRLAEQIQTDRLDILIDLCGHSGGNRIPLLARKPAPVQITWLGYPATTGVPAMDYLLTDSYMVPEHAQEWFTEQIIRISPGWCYAFPPEAESPARDAVPANEGSLLLASFNNPAKLSPAVIRLWSDILNTFPKCRLLLKYRNLADPWACDQLRSRFKAQGLENHDQLIFEAASSRLEYFQRYHQVDLVLDPFPFNGGITTLDALATGRPVVCLHGQSYAGRMGASFLQHIGCPELIGESEQEYLEICRDLIADANRRRDYMRSIPGRLKNSPLCDAETFAGNFAGVMTRLSGK